MNPICTKCNRTLRIESTPVGTSPDGTPVNHMMGYCDYCKIKYTSNQFVYTTTPKMQSKYKCKKCGSTNLTYQTVTESKPTSCLTICLYICLAISVLGWLILIPLILRKKTQTVTYIVCQNCGFRIRK